jgi:RNA polymerase sigma factor (sigma-70 family)
MPVLPETRASLLVRIRSAEDSAAWTEFTGRYGPAVYGYFRRRGLQEADAVDLTQNVFRNILGRIGEFEYDPARGKFRSWLFTIASREFAKFAEQLKRLPVSAETTDLDNLSSPEVDAHTWETSVRRRLFELGLQHVKSLVSEKTMRAFLLTAVDGLDGDAAAAQLAMTRAAVYLARARVLHRLKAFVATLDSEELET